MASGLRAASGNRVAVAARDGDAIGIAMAGAPEEPAAPWIAHLYVHTSEHGSGAGVALLDAVTGRAGATALWVADPNPRAQSFHRKHGFEPDGASRIGHGVREIRMVRPGGSVAR